MALRYSFGMIEEADLVDQAIASALGKGLRTADIMQSGMRQVSTSEMGAAIVDELGTFGTDCKLSSRKGSDQPEQAG